jgi:hypothetical protein
MRRLLGRPLSIALVAASILSAACSQGLIEPPSTPAVVTAELGREFELKIGQTARLNTTGLSLTLRAIPEDSRCPIDVVCVWQGNAKVVLDAQVGEDGPTTEVTLNTGVPSSEARVSGLLVRLVSVSPAPRSSVQIRPDAYAAVLVVSR